MALSEPIVVRKWLPPCHRDIVACPDDTNAVRALSDLTDTGLHWGVHFDVDFGFACFVKRRDEPSHFNGGPGDDLALPGDTMDGFESEVPIPVHVPLTDASGQDIAMGVLEWRPWAPQGHYVCYFRILHVVQSCRRHGRHT